jgi:hypothetical protein
MRKKLSQAEFDTCGIVIENEYTLKGIESMKSFVKEVNEFHPCEIEYEVSSFEGRLYYEHVLAKLKSKLDNLYIQPKGYDKKYHVVHYVNYPNVQNHEIRSVRESIEAPKNIGVLTAKKIKNWVTYQENLHEDIMKVSLQNGSEVADFLKSIEGMDVQFWHNEKSGDIRKGGLLFRFEIDKGYVSKKILLDIDESASLDVFLKLADNQYKK